MDRMEEQARKVKETAPTNDKYGKIYQPAKFEKLRGKSMRKANVTEYRAQRKEKMLEKVCFFFSFSNKK